MRRYPSILVIILLCSFWTLGAPLKDDWLNLKTDNFNLIGNASEKDMKKVAMKLEQFRAAFQALFPRSNLTSPIPTNVVVFKNDSAFRPYKPKRGDGKIDNFIAGYFQPGDDVNYITLAAGGLESETYGTIFHEYVHFIVNTNFGKTDVPAWFNEGLAEYYQTFEMEGDIKAKLGIPQEGHLRLLQGNKLLPLETFFNTSNAALHQHGSHSRSIFYAQAWALVHYFIANKKTDGMAKFLDLSIKKRVNEDIFREAFQMGYADMEKELRKYVARGSYIGTVVTFSAKLNFEEIFKPVPINEAVSQAYLGDLLYHNHRFDDAEPYLIAALKLDPDLSMANTTMGMVKMRQRKPNDAKAFLERAIAKDPSNHLAFYQMAYLLSRDSGDEFGFVTSFEPEKVKRMRELLQKAIELNPSYSESYELSAFISLVTNENIEEGIELMLKALRYQPGNQKYLIRIAELYVRQKKYNEAHELASRISGSASDENTKRMADNVIEQARMRREIDAKNAENRKKYEEALKKQSNNGGGIPALVRRDTVSGGANVEDVEKQTRILTVLGINRELRKIGEGEIRDIGQLQGITCKGNVIKYSILLGEEEIYLGSKDFQGLHLASFVPDMGDAEIGCGVKANALKAVITYKPQPRNAEGISGELVSVEYVPDYFVFMDRTKDTANLVAREPAGTFTVEKDKTSPLPPPPRALSEEDMREARRKEILAQIREQLRKPQSGEKQALGFIESSTCNKNGGFFSLKAGNTVLKLSIQPARQPEIKTYSPEMAGVPIGCGMKYIEIPVVFTYVDKPNKKSKTHGELVSLEFVPKSFVLE